MTYNLKNKFIEEATNHKQRLEQRQRNEAKERKEKGLKVETKVWLLRIQYLQQKIKKCGVYINETFFIKTLLS